MKPQTRNRISVCLQSACRRILPCAVRTCHKPVKKLPPHNFLFPFGSPTISIVFSWSRTVHYQVLRMPTPRLASPSPFPREGIKTLAEIHRRRRPFFLQETKAAHHCFPRMWIKHLSQTSSHPWRDHSGSNFRWEHPRPVMALPVQQRRSIGLDHFQNEWFLHIW